MDSGGDDSAGEMTTLKSLVRSTLRPLGFDFVRYGRGTRRQSLEEAMHHIARLDFTPATVIDVGVAEGTPELYSTFPEAKFLLIEPLVEYVPSLKAILEKVSGDYVLACAASTTGTARLRVPDQASGLVLSGASLLVDDGSPHAPIEREVATVRIDDLVVGHRLEPPFLVKADTQGTELEALAGAQATLEQTEVVALEASFFPFFNGGPQLTDVVRFMDRRGFVAYDIAGGHNRPVDDALAQVDIVFVQKYGRFRQTNRYY